MITTMQTAFSAVLSGAPVDGARPRVMGSGVLGSGVLGSGVLAAGVLGSGVVRGGASLGATARGLRTLAPTTPFHGTGVSTDRSDDSTGLPPRGAPV